MEKNRVYLGEITIFKNPNVHEPAKKFNCSKKIYKTYELQFNKDHIVKVVETGEIDIDSKIQQYAHDNDLDRILKTIHATQNPDLYVAHAGQFGDITDAPTSLIDAQALIKEANAKYNTYDYGQKKGMTLKEYAKTITDEDFVAFINARQAAKKEEKE